MKYTYLCCFFFFVSLCISDVIWAGFAILSQPSLKGLKATHFSGSKAQIAPRSRGISVAKKQPDRPFDCYSIKLDNIHIYCECFLRGLSAVFRALVACHFFHLEVLSHRPCHGF